MVSVQKVTHMNGLHRSALGQSIPSKGLAMAAPSALERLSAPTTPLLSVILLWQHSGVTTIQTGRKSTQLVVVQRNGGIVMLVAKIGLPPSTVAQSANAVAHIALIRTARARGSDSHLWQTMSMQ